MKLLLDSKVDHNLFEPIYFDRPVSSVRRRSIAILVGRHTNLFEVQQIYEIIRAMGHYPVLLADRNLKPLGLPAELYLQPDKKQHLYSNADEALGLIDGCQMLVAGVGLELSAAMQLLLDKILNSYRGSVVLTESALRLPDLKASISASTLIVASTKGLLKLTNVGNRQGDSTGILKKIDILESAFLITKASLICAEDLQLIGLDFGRGNAGIVNSKTSLEVVSFVAILISLLIDRDKPLAPGWLNYLFATNHIYKTIYQKQKNPLALKDFLNSQF